MMVGGSDCESIVGYVDCHGDKRCCLCPSGRQDHRRSPSRQAADYSLSCQLDLTGVRYSLPKQRGTQESYVLLTGFVYKYARRH